MPYKICQRLSQDCFQGGMGQPLVRCADFSGPSSPFSLHVPLSPSQGTAHCFSQLVILNPPCHEIPSVGVHVRGYS